MTLEQRIMEDVASRAVEGRAPLTVHHLQTYVDRPRVWLALFLRHLADVGRLELAPHAQRTAGGWLTITYIHPGREFAGRLDELRHRDVANKRGAA
jgi:hypothetical protein